MSHRDIIEIKLESGHLSSDDKFLKILTFLEDIALKLEELEGRISMCEPSEED